jgi:hypothetical protein
MPELGILKPIIMLELVMLRGVGVLGLFMLEPVMLLIVMPDL